MHIILLTLETLTFNGDALKSKMKTLCDQLNEHDCNERYISLNLQVVEDDLDSDQCMRVDSDQIGLDFYEGRIDCGLSLYIEGDDWHGHNTFDFVKALVEKLKDELIRVDYKSIDFSNMFFESYNFDNTTFQDDIETYHRGDVIDSYFKCFQYYKGFSKENDIVFANLCDDLAVWDRLDSYELINENNDQ